LHVTRRNMCVTVVVVSRGITDTPVLLAMDICLVHPLSFMLLQMSALAPYLLFWLQVHLMAVEVRESVFAPAMESSQ
jgi:hypothetical protein